MCFIKDKWKDFEPNQKYLSIVSGLTSITKLHNYLKGHKVSHEMHPKIIGNPDVLIKNKNLAIFLHGCFWHKCPKRYKEPKSRKN